MLRQKQKDILINSCSKYHFKARNTLVKFNKTNFLLCTDCYDIWSGKKPWLW